MAASFAAAFGVSSAAVADEKPLDEQRREVMQSKKYLKQCERFNKRFGNVQTEAALEGKEPKLLCRIAPAYEERCMQNGARLKEVKLIYDVLPEGYTHNIRLKHADDRCVVRAAVASLLYWSYEPSESGGSDLETTITFELTTM